MDILSVKQRFGIIGNNQKLNDALEIALRVAATDLTVLVTGESGVGKEYFPQVIHSYSARKHEKYFAINCGAIPEGTIDSELFGHEKGAFTGATDSRKGYFEMANGGTLFLDEVGELPLTTQVRLLRVLQTGEFIRVGASNVQKTNVRVVAATNANLSEAISRGLFREDLYYRLNTVPIFMPALRERKEDIYLLFRKFCSDTANKYAMPVVRLDETAREMLENYRWPGNVRQLKNVAEQLSVIEQTREINVQILSKYLPDVFATNTPMLYSQQSSQSHNTFDSEREILYKVLFDLRNDVNELKEMVNSMRRQGTNPQVVPSVVENSHSPIVTNNTDMPKLVMPHVEPYQNDRYDSVIEVDEIGLTEKELRQKEDIMKALKKHKGKRKDAATELFISERTLYRRIKELGIDE